MNGYEFQNIRETNGFSKERMAEIMNASVSDIDDWENGILEPMDYQVDYLAWAIGDSEDELKSRLEMNEYTGSSYSSDAAPNRTAAEALGDLTSTIIILGAKKAVNSIKKHRVAKKRIQNSSYKIVEPIQKQRLEVKTIQPISKPEVDIKSTKTKKRHPVLIWAIIVVLLVVGCGYYYYQLPATKLSSEDCVGKQYSAIVRSFETAGFENIASVPMNDLSYEELELNGQVDCVDIGTHTCFSANQKIIGENDVSVFYHSPKIVKVGYSSKEFEGQQFKDVVALLNENGFYDIEIIEKPDIRFGIFNKEGSVNYVQIGKEKKYDVNTEYPINTKIQIEYHTAYKKQ